MQRPERRKGRRRFSPPPLPRAPLDRHRTGRPPPRPRRPRRRQAPPFAVVAGSVWAPVFSFCLRACFSSPPPPLHPPRSRGSGGGVFGVLACAFAQITQQDTL